MKTIIVEGSGWRVAVDVDDEVFPKYVDMTFEAMTQGVEQFFLNKYEEMNNGNEDVVGLGIALKAYEEGYENDMEKEVMALTELVLRNASFHSAADMAKEVAIEQIRKEQDEL